MFLLLLLPVLLTLSIAKHGGHHAHQMELRCHQLKLCSLGKVKPFLGDIYDSEAEVECMHGSIGCLGTCSGCMAA